jgi:Double-GTPase 2
MSTPIIPPTPPVVAPTLSPLRRQWLNWTQRRKCPYCYEWIINERTRVLGTSTHIPVCANTACNKDLPPDFFEASSKVIAIIGGTDSGKTTYMTVLAKKLTETNLLNIIGDCVADIPNADEKKAHDDQVKILYEKEEMLGGTPTSAPVLPLVVRVKDDKNKQTLFLSVQDASGAAMRTFSSVVNQSQIRHADGIICILDPLNIHIILNELINQKDYSGDSPSVNVYQEITYIFDFLKAAGRVKKGKVNIPIAFCISKIDLLKDITSLYLPQDVDRSFMNLSDAFKEIDIAIEDITAYMDELGKVERDERLLTTIKTRFNQFALFPVSSLGQEVGSDKKLKSKPEPEGIEHPLLWMFRQLKFI